MHEAYILFTVLIGTMALFIWGYWRYDIVAFFALMLLVLIGIVPFNQAFIGFSNPAVITVACVMIITQTINESGIVDHLVNKLTPITSDPVLHIFSLCMITAVLSAFMNNVGALALMMPIAIQTAHKAKRSPAMVLMPLAFASVLGGLTTAIGTPPNLLISAYRQQITGHPFAMFDFSAVGVVVASITIIFIALIGWRLLPKERKGERRAEEMFQIQDYITEIIVSDDSPVVGKTRYDLEQLIEGEFIILGLIRNKNKRLIVPANEILQAGDILIIEAAHDDLQRLLASGKLELAGGEIVSPERLRSRDIGLMEAVIPPSSRVEGRSWHRMRLRSRYQLNLLAIARSGKPFKKRLNQVNLRAGDVVLLQGQSDIMHDAIHSLGVLPLVERGVQVGMRRKAYIPLFIFALAIMAAALQIFPVQIAFAAAVLVLTIINVIPVRRVYQSIDWSIIVLLAAMIPIGGALQSTGATQLIAQGIISLAGNGSSVLLIALLFFITMTISDFMNNAATAVVMAPIAVSIAQSMHVSIDPFLMTVAVGASCSFLTPISHQNNTLVMGPGGYKFTDYMRLGLPVELLVLVLGVPMILWIWPI